jgi:hypothetical protein
MSNQESTVLLRDGAGHEVPAHLLGAAQGAEDGRVCVVLDGDRGLILPLGSDVSLEVPATQGVAGHLLHACVLQHRVGRDAAWYVLEVDEDDRPLLTTSANRRQFVRMRPTVTAPVEALLSAPDGSHEHPVTIRDLSEAGAGLIIRPPEDLELLAQPRLRLVLGLAEDPEEMVLLARLVFRRGSGSMVHYGLAFDALASPGFEESRARLAAWVVARQTGQQTRRAG